MKCECYSKQEIIDYYSLSSDRRLISICNGTKERDVCSCKGDRAKCDFYPEIREKALKDCKEENKKLKSNRTRKYIIDTLKY